jgi:hypothetical protein
VARRATRQRAIGSRAFWIAVAVLALAGLGVRLWTTDRGQALLVRHGIFRQFVPSLGGKLDVALARTFLDLGLLRGDVKARVVAFGGRRVREYTFTAPGHRTATQCHVALRRAAERVHATVQEAREQHAPEALSLRLGFGAATTHLVLIKPRSAPAVARADGRGPRIALVIDDLGHNFNATTRGFLELGVPVTLAVLPDRPKSKDVVRARSRPCCTCRWSRLAARTPATAPCASG